MSTSTVKSDLDSIGVKIAGAKQMEANAKAVLLAARNQLAGIPTEYAATIAETAPSS